MIDRSETSIFLCDHKKIAKLGVPIVSDLKSVDTIITDIKLTEEWKTVLSDNDVNVIEVLK